MSSISDPGRPGRRDRRRAQKLVDTGFAERRLTAAERALRTQRIAAAHTRGDLAMITRDLLAPTTASLGKALDPATLSSMRAESGTRATTRVPGTVSSLPAGVKIDLSGIQHKVRMIILIAVVVFVGICGLGLAAAVIPVFMHGSNDAAPEPTPVSSSTASPIGESSAGTPTRSASDLHSVAGWKTLVAAIKSVSGSTSVYDIVVYPSYAAVGLDGDGAVDRRFYQYGRWQDSVSVRTPAVGALVDLGQIDPQVIERLPRETASRFNIDKPSGAYIIINAISGGPQILVYVESSGGGAQYSAYDLKGRQIS